MPSTIAPSETTLPAFVPLALEEADIAAYDSIAADLGCDTETCAEGFMLATPAARDAALRLWQGARAINHEAMAAPEDRAQARLRRALLLETLRGLIGLDTARMPHAALAAAGLRYSA